MNVLICSERFLFRFGADRALILLGKGLKEKGHSVSVMANRYDRRTVDSFASEIVEVPEFQGSEHLTSNEHVAQWLRANWNRLSEKIPIPDVVLVSGWPFFAAIPFFRELNSAVVFIDFGAVPLDGYTGGPLIIQQKLRELRKQHLGQASHIIAISEFLLRTQSWPDTDGKVPVQTILLGADHMDSPVWGADEIPEASSEPAALVDRLLAEHRPLLLCLGRWEPGCYKNSHEAFTLMRKLRAEVPRVALLVLAEPGLDIPADLRESVFPLGFPDDQALVTIMRRVRLGVSMSLWEGFNLPLAEMQWLGRPALVFRVGAHPEVVADPWCLCDNLDEMSRKAAEILNGRGLNSKLWKRAVEKFRSRFTWERSTRSYVSAIEEIYAESQLTIVLDVTNSTRDPANSGVIRVTRRFGRELQAYHNPIFVVWDSQTNRYVLPTREEWAQLAAFNGPRLIDDECVSPDTVRRICLETALKRRGMELGWLVLTETMIETRFAVIRRYARRLGLRLAAVFHDSIPVLRPDLCNPEMRENHSDYMIGLSECDLILPNSEFSADCLRSFWSEKSIEGCKVVANVLPGEFAGCERAQKAAPGSGEAHMLCVSTLEPRKNHKTLIDACLSLERTLPGLDWSLTLVGNRYAGAFEIAEWIETIATRNPRVRWLGIVDDETLHRLYREASFTIYPSLIEGFGIPIVESIWHGRPCICSNQGVMAELAAAGGCVTVDVQDPKALAAAIVQLATDHELWHSLAEQAVNRPVRMWSDYVLQFRSLLMECRHLLPSATERISNDLVSWPEILYPGCILPNWQMHDSERLALTAVLSRVKPRCSIEVGSYFGGSLSLISQYSEVVFSIGTDPTVPTRLVHLSNVKFLTGDSSHMLPNLLRELTSAGLGVDVILIDGDHSAEGIKRDLSKLLHYIPSGPLFVLMHDSFNPDCRRGMLEAPWSESPYCHWVDIDFVPGRAIEHDGPSQGELWGGLAMAYFHPAARQDALLIHRSAESLFQASRTIKERRVAAAGTQ